MLPLLKSYLIIIILFFCRKRHNVNCFYSTYIIVILFDNQPIVVNDLKMCSLKSLPPVAIVNKLYKYSCILRKKEVN